MRANREKWHAHWRQVKAGHEATRPNRAPEAASD